MSHPQIEVLVDGAAVGGHFFKQLVSLSIDDREGIQSDRLAITFSEPGQGFAPPRRGARMTVSLRNSGEFVGVGEFIIDSVEWRFFPNKLTLTGHSADLQQDMKTSRTKHWDNISVRDLVTEKAADYGLEYRISDAVSGHVYEWLGQQEESDLNFLNRLARRFGALFTIKAGTLLWLERGVGATADGASLPVAVVRKTEIIRDFCFVSESDIDRFKTVKCYWQDRRGARRREVVVPADPEASGERILRQPFSSQAEAEAAANSAAREITRGLTKTSCSLIGRPELMAGQPITYAGVHPQADGREFILEQVTHTFSKAAGLRTRFSGKLKIES